MLSKNQSVQAKYEGKVVFGKVVKSIDTPFDKEPLYKVELENWIMSTKNCIIDTIYISEADLNGVSA